MTKYYKVYLNEYLINKDAHSSKIHPIVCKFRPLLTKMRKELVLEEIVTGKIIYPSTSDYRRGLTYELIDFSSRAIYVEMSAVEVKEWLKSMSEEKLQEYIDNIYRLEQKAIRCYEEDKQRERDIKLKEKEAGKSIKRKLRTIKRK